MKVFDVSTLENALQTVSAVLAQDGAEPEAVVICGGAALLSLGFITRRTKDVDVLARVNPVEGLVDPRPFSPALTRAVEDVAKALGLPVGFLSRLQRREYGSHLTVFLPDRYDLIHLKLFAGVDQGPGRHWSDLKALNPTTDEMLAAARWVLGQDAGDVFPSVVRDALRFHDYAEIADQL
jgi:hypothetical protein